MHSTDQPNGGQPREVPRNTPLDRAVRELERHVARGGWDGPVRVFALVKTAQALQRDPSLRDELPFDLLASADADPEHITSVEQEDLPDAGSVEELLAQLGWGPAVDGAAIVCERIVVPPEVEVDMPEDPVEAVQYLMDHPQREDVRLAVGVLRDGSTSCAIRTRSQDDDFSVGSGPDLAPGVAAALRATLED
ncbi:MAG TPA: PPA1309 family protein [Actinomycetales bacterium]|nr:PPA1309 family protein [Actinomycetales bacterium]